MPDLDAVIAKINERIALRQKTPQKRPKRKRKGIRKLPIVSLDDAIKRLGDEEVWKKAGKGFRWEKDD